MSGPGRGPGPEYREPPSATLGSAHSKSAETAVAIPIFQSPGANALQLSTDVRRKMEELKQNFPEGIDYSVVYDPTVFVRHSIEAVVHTLLEATLLVVLVVVLVGRSGGGGTTVVK